MEKAEAERRRAAEEEQKQREEEQRLKEEEERRKTSENEGERNGTREVTAETEEVLVRHGKGNMTGYAISLGLNKQTKNKN